MPVKKPTCCWGFCEEPRRSENSSYCTEHDRQYAENYKHRTKEKKRHVVALNKELTTIEIENFVPKQNDMDEINGYLPLIWSKEQWDYWGTKYSHKNWKYKLSK